MILSELPGEILDLIVTHKDCSYILLDLWKCGNGLLTSKLRASVTDVYLLQDQLLGGRVPRLLSSLQGLRSLTLQSFDALMSSPFEWEPLISSLPMSLESLHLKSEDSCFAFVNFAPESTAIDPECVETQLERGMSHFIDIGCRFPRLRALTCDLSGSDLSPKEFAVALPPHLTQLTSQGLVINDTMALCGDLWLAYLPKSLESISVLNVREEEEAEPEGARLWDLPAFLDDWSNAPPNLHTIGHLNMALVTRLDMLPRTLTHCILKCPPLLLPSALKQAPTHLNCLVLNVHDDLDAHLLALPPHLTRFDLATKILLGASHIALLPRTLIELRIKHDMDWASLKEEQQSQVARGARSAAADGALPSEVLSTATNTTWPPNLLRLATSIPSAMPLVEVPFPSTLTSLNLTRQPETAANSEPYVSDVSWIPPRLTSLMVQAPSTTHPSIFSFHLLPPTLVSLSKNGQTSRNIDGERVSEIWPAMGSSTQHLKALRTISLSSPLVERIPDGSPSPIFPSHLTSMLEVPLHIDWFAKLPRTLLKLSIEVLSGLKTSPFIKTNDLFAYLPPRLKSLVIERLDDWEEKWEQNANLDIVFISNSFSTLAQLEELTVRAGVFSTSLLRVMSRRMKSLVVCLASIDKEDAPRIPPRMTKLFVGTRVDYKKPWVAAHWPIRAVSGIPSIHTEVRAAVQARAQVARKALNKA